MNSEEDIFQTKEKSVVQGEKRAIIKGCNVYNILLKYKIVGIKLNRKTVNIYKNIDTITQVTHM